MSAFRQSATTGLILNVKCLYSPKSATWNLIHLAEKSTRRTALPPHPANGYPADRCRALHLRLPVDLDGTARPSLILRPSQLCPSGLWCWSLQVQPGGLLGRSWARQDVVATLTQGGGLLGPWLLISTSEAAQHAPDGSSSDLESPGDFGFAEAGAVQLTDLRSMRGRGCRPPQTLSVQSVI